jgi:hypothetical protein
VNPEPTAAEPRNPGEGFEARRFGIEPSGEMATILLG